MSVMTDVKEQIEISKFRALWWDLPSAPLVTGYLDRLRCQEPGCTAALVFEDLISNRACGNCGTPENFNFSTAILAALDNRSIGYCKNCKGKWAPTLDELEAENESVLCEQGHSGWFDKVTLAKAHALARWLTEWRARYFRREMDGGLVHFDQMSVRIVPVEHAEEVKKIIAAAIVDFKTQVPVLDVFGLLPHLYRGDTGERWEGAIRFPEFVAADVDAKKLVYETVRNSTLQMLEEIKAGVLTTLGKQGEIGKRAKSNILKRIAELKERDVWGVTRIDPSVKEQIDALDGLLAE